MRRLNSTVAALAAASLPGRPARAGPTGDPDGPAPRRRPSSASRRSNLPDRRVTASNYLTIDYDDH